MGALPKHELHLIHLENLSECLTQSPHKINVHQIKLKVCQLQIFSILAIILNMKINPLEKVLLVFIKGLLEL